MDTLAAIQEKQLAQVFEQRKEIYLEISKDAIKFSQKLSKPTEYPPSPVVLDPYTLAHAILFADSTEKSKYALLVLFVYALGGKIFYRDLENGNYEAHITWSD